MIFTHMLASLKMMSDALFLGRDADDGNSLTLHAVHSLFFCCCWFICKGVRWCFPSIAVLSEVQWTCSRHICADFGIRYCVRIRRIDYGVRDCICQDDCIVCYWNLVYSCFHYKRWAVLLFANSTFIDFPGKPIDIITSQAESGAPLYTLSNETLSWVFELI